MKIFLSILCLLTSFSLAADPATVTIAARDVINQETDAIIAREGVEQPGILAEVMESADESSTTEESNILSSLSDAGEGMFASTQGEGMPWLKTLLASAFVISLILVCAQFFKKRLTGKSSLRRKKNMPLAIIQTLPVGMKRQLVVADFEGTRVLLGMSANQMQLLHAKDDFENVSQVVAESISETPTQQMTANIDHNDSENNVRTERISSDDTAIAAEEDNADLSNKIRVAVKTLKPLPSAAASSARMHEDENMH